MFVYVLKLLGFFFLEPLSANTYPVHAGYCSRDGVSEQQKHHPSGFGCSQLHVSFFQSALCKKKHDLLIIFDGHITYPNDE